MASPPSGRASREFVTARCAPPPPPRPSLSLVVRCDKCMRAKISKALSEIEYGTEFEACEASKQLADMNGQDVLTGLLRILRTGERPCSRAAAAYALSFNKNREAVTALLVCASNPDEQDSVRAQAVEGLSMHLNSDSPRRLRLKAEDLMIGMLRSPSPTLRFWACFGLGGLRCRRAIPQLRKLKRTDRDVCPGWWYVWEEAEDAIEWIAGRPGQDRQALHIRTQQSTEPNASPNRRPARQVRARTRRRGGGR
jgi:hypothetical protein